MFIPTKEAFYDMTPTEFEKYSLEILQEQFEGAPDFTIKHNVIERVSDGNYQIDGLINFKQAGLLFKVIVECKHYKSSISREKVVVLYDKLRALNAQKGILISSSSFQKGAIQFASEHGIALIQITPTEQHTEIRSDCNYLIHSNVNLHNYDKPYIGVLQTYTGGIKCDYLRKTKKELINFILSKSTNKEICND